MIANINSKSKYEDKNVYTYCDVDMAIFSLEISVLQRCNILYKTCYTGWPRKNATTLIVNFMNIVDETELFCISFVRTFIFQQNDTMIISFG